MVVDQFTDPQHALLHQLARECPEDVSRVKSASLSGSVPGTVFADQQRGLFPLHTPEHALLSRIYATKQASDISPDVIARIDRALSIYGVNYTPQTSTKQASVADAESDAGVGAEHYLLPQYRGFLVKEAAHVGPAADALIAQRNRLRVATVVQAATRLVKKAADFGMQMNDLPDEIYKYAGLVNCDTGRLVDWVEARAAIAPDAQSRDSYEKIAKHIIGRIPADGIARNREDLTKIASLLEDLDRANGLHHQYNTSLLDPMETVFNMDKVAEPTVTLAGKTIPVRSLVALPDEIYAEILGDDVLEHVAGADGSRDPAELVAVLRTLPADMQSMFVQHVQAYL